MAWRMVVFQHEIYSDIWKAKNKSDMQRIGGWLVGCWVEMADSIRCIKATLRIFGEEIWESEERGGGNDQLELSIIAVARGSWTLDSWYIVHLRAHCASSLSCVLHSQISALCRADCVECRLCNTHNPPKLCIPHYASLDPAHPTICQCRVPSSCKARRGKGIQDQPSGTSPWQRIMRHLHNYCEAHPLLQSATIPPCRMTRYAHCIHEPTDRARL